MDGNLILNFQPWGTRAFAISRTNTATLELALENWNGLDAFLRPKIALQAGRLPGPSVTNVITYGLDEAMETLSGTLYLNGLVMNGGVYRGDGAGLFNLVEHDPNWEAARVGGTTFGAEVRLPKLSVTDSGICRSTNSAALSLMGGDAWNTGAMMELGGDGLSGGDVQNGSGQILLKGNASRFRIRDREGWTDIADFRGDGSSYLDGPLTIRGNLIVTNNGQVMVGGKALSPKSYVARAAFPMYNPIPTNGIMGTSFADIPPWAKTITRVAGRLGFVTNFPQNEVTNIHFYVGLCTLSSPIKVTNQQYVCSLKTNNDAGILSGILSTAPLRQYVFDVSTSVAVTNWLNLNWYGYFYNTSTNAIPAISSYYWEYWVEMTE